LNRNAKKGGALAGTINLQPQVLNLAMYSGDGFSFKLKCSDANGAPIDMGGSVKAQIRNDRLHPEDSSLVDFDVSTVDAYLGIIGLSLTGDDTQSLTDDHGDANGKFSGVWDVQWTPAGLEPRTICQGIAECVSDVSR
jgi:hypothetical protein